MERNNRKSHLAPQLSPSTQDLLRGSDSPTTAGTISSSQPTPTSAKLPLSNSGTNLASQSQQQSQMISPREQVINTIQGNGNIRSPREEQQATMGMGNLSLGRSGGSVFQQQAGMQMQPPMGQRMSSSRSQQQVESPVERPSAQREPSFTHNLPMRPAPPAGPMPPPPVPGKEGMYDPRRQQYPPQNGYAQQPQQPQNGYYGSSSGYGRENERQYSREEQNGRGYRDDRNGGY